MSTVVNDLMVSLSLDFDCVIVHFQTVTISIGTTLYAPNYQELMD